MPVTILLVDDHNLVNEGISRIIAGEKRFQVVAQLGNGQDAIDFVNQNNVDLIIMDVNMPGVNGIAATENIKKSNPGVKIIGLSMLGDYGTVCKMLESGVDGYLLKNTSGEELFTAIDSVLNGTSYITAEVQQVLLKGIKSNKALPHLTKKEIDVLKYIAAGLTNKAIATKLNLGEETIKSHRKNIMSKFDIHNTAELVRFAVDHNLL